MNDRQRAKFDAHAVKAHMILAAASQEGEVERTPDYAFGFTGSEFPTHNFFIPLTLTGLTDETLADASAFFRSRATMYAISLEEHRVPDGTEYLSSRRYQPLPPQPIMASTDLSTRFEGETELRIKPITTVPGMTALYSVLEAVYDYAPDTAMLLFPTQQLGEERITHFAGYFNGQPTTVATAVYSNGVASVWNLSTMDDFRRRGFAADLLRYILADAAANRGCDQAMIYATPMSFSLFNKLSFQLYAMRQWFLPQEVG